MQYTVPVRALCEFTAKSGDLDLRFTPAPTALQGIAGHAAVTARRGAGYEREVTLEGQVGRLRLRGRADGFDPEHNRLEEIKTHRGDLARQPANHRHLHWAQLRTYGALLCEARGIERLELALVYYDIARQKETVLREERTREELAAMLQAQCEAFVAWADQELAHRDRRDEALAALAFPHPAFRTGQRELAEAAWRSATHGLTLLAQAPTGIGKTVATVFPVLKAAPGAGLDKVFFLAAKTPGRQLALDAFEQAAPAGRTPLRVLELVARDKACEHPDKACHGDSCPLARGFYDRLPAARAEAIGGRMHGAALREVALRHSVCPYYLSQELARWADVVVGDYHYFLDGSALLHAFTQEHGWRVALLVDEAHNLLERGREMYSATLQPAALAAARRGAPRRLHRPLAALAREWEELARAQDAPYVVHEQLPDRWFDALQRASSAIADQLAEAPQEPAPALQQFHLEALAMLRLAETFGEHSVFDITLRGGPRGPQAIPCIRNLLPAPFLGPRWRDAQASVLFSATLAPFDFYRNTLGLPEATRHIDVASPFDGGQLQVRVVRSISTRWAHRERSVAPIAELIVRHWRGAPGNYLAFFSSFDYLGQVEQAVRERAPSCRCSRNHRACRRRSGASSCSGSCPVARRWGSRCWAAASARASTCRATGWWARSSRRWACRR